MNRKIYYVLRMVWLNTNEKYHLSFWLLFAQTKAGTPQLPLQGEIHNCLFITKTVSQ